MNGEIVRTVERAVEVLNPIQRYNISVGENKNRWDCEGQPVRPNRPSRLFPFINNPSDLLASELAGAAIGREFSTIPEYPIRLGTVLPPLEIRKLSFLGEHMSDEQMRAHLLRHEVGHAAIDRDLAAVLQRMVPGNELAYLRTMMFLAEDSREEGRMPLSQLYKLNVYRTPEKRFIEDMAEMYAIKARSFVEGPQIWNHYRQLVTRSNPDLETLFDVIDELFKESQRLTYS